MSVDVERYRSALLEERKRVEDAMHYIHDEHPDATDEMHLATHLMDSAALTLDQELDDTLEENSGNVLAEIDEALRRIEEGTYGTCTNCGGEIPAERLEALPHATQCIDCKRREAEQ
jgi:RNA polymerase-binding transcription factor